MAKNWADEVRQKLKKFKKDRILLTVHAGERAAFRGISREEVITRLSEPADLIYSEPDGDRGKGERFKCYFDVSKHICHSYVISISTDQVDVVTVFPIDKRKQKRLAKYSKTYLPY